MQNLNKAKKIKIRVKNRRYKKLSMFQLQNQGSGMFGATGSLDEFNY